MTPRFSVIIPALNEEKFLPNLLASLAKQTNRDFDVVVVDGGSTDATIAAAKLFADAIQLTVVKHHGTGVSAQRNFGARLAKGQWLVFADADSVLMPNFIERCIWFIGQMHPDIFAVWFRPDSPTMKFVLLTHILNAFTDLMLLLGKPWAPGPLSVIKREAFEAVGGFDENVTYGEDHELGVSIFRKGFRYNVLHETVCIYSYRRFRKEGLLLLAYRSVVSSLKVAITNKGIRKVAGFVSGGSLYNKKSNKRV